MVAAQLKTMVTIMEGIADVVVEIGTVITIAIDMTEVADVQDADQRIAENVQGTDMAIAEVVAMTEKETAVDPEDEVQAHDIAEVLAVDEKKRLFHFTNENENCKIGIWHLQAWIQ